MDQADKRLAMRSEYARLAANYRALSALDFDRMPSPMDKRGRLLHDRLELTIRRLARASRTTDHVTQQGLGFGDASILDYTPPGMIYNLYKWFTGTASSASDKADQYLAQQKVMQELIDKGVSPAKAAQIVSGDDRAPTWKIVLITTGVVVGGYALVKSAFTIAKWLK